MKLEMKSERLNPHMKRKEIMMEAVHENEPTPSKQALHELIAKQFGFEDDKTDVRHIYTEGGAARSAVKVFVWTEKKPAVKEKKKKKEVKKG